jgi:hypothetical protein
VSVTWYVLDRLPLVPVIVSVYVPDGAERVVEMLSFELVPVVEVGFGENVPVTPDGRALTLKPTEPAKPPVRVMVIE